MSQQEASVTWSTDVELTIKNYRSFQDTDPARIRLRKGLVAIVGPNNSGKSSLLRFFYDFRSLFAQCGQHDVWNAILGGKLNLTSLPPEVSSRTDLYCNANDREMEIEVRIFPEENSSSPVVISATITIYRDGSFSGELYTREGLVPVLQSRTHISNVGHAIRDGRSIADMSSLLAVMVELSKTMYIGPFRSAISLFDVRGYEHDESIQKLHTNYYDLSTGPRFIKWWQDQKTSSSKTNAQRAQRITDDLARIFSFGRLEINAEQFNRSLRFVVGSGEEIYSMSELGSGIAQFFVVLANALQHQPSYILIDEPELNLHPRLQLDFLMALEAQAQRGVVFATHSMGLARAGAESVYVVRKVGRQSQVRLYEKNPNLSELLGALSFSAYQELGFTKVLLVEGTTEVKTLQQLLRKIGGDHNVLLLPLGGGSLINGGSHHELGELKRISSEIFALIDSEKETAGAALSTDRSAFVKTCQDLEIGCHVLARRATENYFPTRVVQKVKGDKCPALAPYERLGDRKKYGWSKADNWRMAQEMTKEEFDAADDLAQFLTKLCSGS